MKFDLKHILKHFAVEDGRLVRKLATGHLRPVRLVDRGRLSSMLDGVRYYGPEVAYACIHRVVPLYPIVQVDGDAFNMSENNLMPARLGRLRYRSIETPGGFRHPLSRGTFVNERLCHYDWVQLARRQYMRDFAYVRQLEDEMQGRKPEVPETVVVPRRVAAAIKSRGDRPEAVAGRSWHWWGDSWLSLPEAVHCSDDWMVRAAVVSQHPGARFVYDEVAQRTVSIV